MRMYRYPQLRQMTQDMWGESSGWRRSPDDVTRAIGLAESTLGTSALDYTENYLLYLSSGDGPDMLSSAWDTVMDPVDGYVRFPVPETVHEVLEELFQS